MLSPRILARKLMGAALRHSAPESRDWAKATLRELDFIENDWAALFWALGSTTAIFRHSGRHWLVRLRNQGSLKEVGVNLIQKRAVGVASGAGIALVLAISALALLQLLGSVFPVLDMEGGMSWSAWMLVIALPELIILLLAWKFWSKRRPMAVGILLSAIVLGTHFVMHAATHIKGQ